MALTKISGGILDPGINVAGVVTATGFDGPFIGGGSGVNAGILTATGLDVNGNGDISGNLVVGGNLTANGDFTTLNTTLREVELLRVDADSSEPAGIITQTGAGNILSLYDGVAELFTVADGGNVTIKNITGTPNFNIQGTNASATAESNLNFLLRDGNSADRTIAKVAARNTGNGGYGALDFYTAFNNTNTRRMSIHHNGNVGIGSTLPDYPLDVTGSIGFSGQTRGLTQSASSPTYSFDGDSDTGMYRGNGVNILSFATAGQERLSISATGVASFTGDVGVGTGTTMETSGQFTTVSNIKISANSNNHSATARLQLGADQNFEIYHNASRDNIIDVDRGNLVIKNSGSDLPHGSAIINRTDGQFLVANQAQNSYRIKAYDGGAVQLFHNNNLRLETDANGVQIKPRVGGVTQLGIAQTTTTAYSINGSISFINSSNTTAQIQGRTGSASTTGDMIFLCNNVGDETLAVLEDGKVRVPDRGMFVAGSGNDLRIYHSSSDNNSYIVEGGSGDLLIRGTQIKLQDASGSDYLRGFTGGAVYLHNAGATKFETTSTGVHVTGEVSALQDYPDLRPRLDFNFAAEKKLDPRITYQREGPASFTDKLGKVVLVGEDVPRFDHNPSTGESKGLLMEVIRTNIIYPSSDWSSANYTHENNNTTREPNTTDTEDPAGTFSATKITPEQGVSTLRSIYWGTTITFTNAVKFTMSAFAKSTTGLHLQLRPRGQGSDKAWATFNLTTGVVGNSGGTVLVSTKIEKYPNDWYRCSLTFTGGGSTGGGFGALIMDDGNDGEAATHTGDASKSIFLWGAQFETGSFATSYIPTNGATATRGNEHAVIDGEDFSDFYNPVESSVLAVGTIQRPVEDQGQLNIFHIGDNNEDGHGVFREHGTKDVWYHIRNNNSTPSGGNLNPNGFGDWDAGEEARIAIAFKDGDQAISVNGGNQITATVTSSYPTADITKMWIGSHGNGSYFEGHIKRIAYYPKLLTDNQLNTLTA